jgi:hypothetical protein
MLAGLAAGALALMAWLGIGLVSGPQKPAVAVAPRVADATVNVAHGPVEVNLQDGNVTRSVRAPDPLHMGDVVTTGAAAGADVVFSSNAIVHLGPNTSLVIGPHGGNAAELGAVLLSGTAKVAAGSTNQGFKIGTSVGVVAMPANQLAEVNIQFDAGVKVITGEINLQTQDTLGRVLISGQEITLNDIKLNSATGDIQGLDVVLPAPPPPPMAFTLEPEEGRVLKARAGGHRFRRARKKTPLVIGDSVRIARRGAANIRMEPNMLLHMASNALFTVGESSNDAHQHKASGTLGAGAVEAALIKEDVPSVMQLRVANTDLYITPTDREASVDVDQEGERAQVYVRFGEARIGDSNGPTIPAGATLELADGHLRGSIKKAYPNALALRPGKASEVYFRGQIPPVRFILPQGAGQNNAPRHLQLARDNAFKNVVSAEAVTQDSFPHDRIPLGKSYWRTTDAQDKVTSLVMATEAPQICRTCRKENKLSDSGERVVVRYEINTPTMVFSWAQVPDAAGYTLRVYGQKDLKTPLWVHDGNTTTYTPPKPLEEGIYYWYVDMLPANGAPAVTGAMNTLELVYSPQTDGLDLRTPGPQQKTRRKRFISQGRIDPGSRLAINDRNVPVNAQGYFRLAVPLTIGANTLVYKVTQGKQADRYYLRQIMRTR